MNIPGVSAATNYAAVQSPRLTQLSSGLTAVKQGGTDFQSSLIGGEVAGIDVKA